jgi:hypothetical protein
MHGGGGDRQHRAARPVDELIKRAILRDGSFCCCTLASRPGRAQRLTASKERAQNAITSSHIESTVKQINRRVKGTEKFWSEGGAEALLQLAADHLSETNPLATFWRERPGRATGQRHYQSAG